MASTKRTLYKLSTTVIVLMFVLSGSMKLSPVINPDYYDHLVSPSLHVCCRSIITLLYTGTRVWAVHSSPTCQSFPATAYHVHAYRGNPGSRMCIDHCHWKVSLWETGHLGSSGGYGGSHLLSLQC